MQKKPDYRFMMLIIAVLGVIITISSILWAASAQNSRFENSCEKINKIEEKSNNNEKKIIGIGKDIEYIKNGIDEIKKEIKK